MIWFAIYWLFCFAVVIHFQAKKGARLNWKVLLWTFLFSPFLPLVMIYQVIKNIRDR